MEIFPVCAIRWMVGWKRFNNLKRVGMGATIVSIINYLSIINYHFCRPSASPIGIAHWPLANKNRTIQSQ